MQKVFEENMENELNKMQPCNIEEEWRAIKNNIKVTAEHLGEMDNRKNEEWFDEECQKAIEVKNEARKKYLQRGTRQAVEEYREKREAATKIYREGHRKYE